MSDFRIDRRPVAGINLYGGLYDQTPTGQSKRFYEPGGVEWAIEHKFQPMRDIGYERFMMWLPAGSNRQQWMASAQWGPLPDYRKQEYEEILMPWVRENKVELGVYMGFQLHDEYSLRMPNNEVRIPDLNKAQDREWYNVTIGNWARLGCQWFGFDAASKYEAETYELSKAFYAAGIKIGGEALPTIRDPKTNEWSVKTDFIDKFQWMCIDMFLRHRDPNYQWKFDPKTTEVLNFFSGHAVLDGFPEEDLDMIKLRARQGFVVSSMKNADKDTSKWVYEVGMAAMDMLDDPPEPPKPPRKTVFNIESLEQLELDQSNKVEPPTKNTQEKKILLAMPGKIANQQALWAEITKNKKLAENIDIVFQANAYHKWNHKYPDELLKDYTGREQDIAVEQFNATNSRYTNLNWFPKMPTHGYLDYEPKHIDPKTEKTSTWQYEKIQQGYNDSDKLVLNLLYRGTQMSVNAQQPTGMALTTYRVPILNGKAVTEQEAAKQIKSSKPFSEMQDWIWMDCYWRSADAIDDSNIEDYKNRIRTHYRALIQLGKPVIPFIDPIYNVTNPGKDGTGFGPEKARGYYQASLDTFDELGITTFGIWTNMQRDESVAQHVENIVAGLDIFEGFISKSNTEKVIAEGAD